MLHHGTAGTPYVANSLAKSMLTNSMRYHAFYTLQKQYYYLKLEKYKSTTTNHKSLISNLTLIRAFDRIVLPVVHVYTNQKKVIYSVIINIENGF